MDITLSDFSNILMKNNFSHLKKIMITFVL